MSEPPLRADGRPLVGHEVRVVDAAGRELPDGLAGELQARGPTVELPSPPDAVSPGGGWKSLGRRGRVERGRILLEAGDASPAPARGGPLYRLWFKLCFAAFGLLALLAFVFRAPRASCWAWSGFCARSFLWWAGCPLTVRETERLRGVPSPAAFVCNHQSDLDAVVLMAALPRRPLAIVAKRQLAESFVTRAILARLGALLVERFDPKQAAEDAKQLPAALRAGRDLLVFPEGTCLRQPGVWAFQPGAFLAVAHAEVPLVILAIRGSRQVLRPDVAIPYPHRLEVEVVEVLPARAPGRARGGFRRARAFGREARAAILAALGEPDLGDEDAMAHLRRILVESGDLEASVAS